MPIRSVCIAMAIGVVTCGCASARLAAPRLTPAQCATDRAVRYVDRFAAQPAGTGVDEVLDARRLQLLGTRPDVFFRFTERGQYRASEGRIVFERKPGQTVWPYKFEGEVLHLTEAPSEIYAYRRR